jgi:hypothetical protein
VRPFTQLGGISVSNRIRHVRDEIEHLEQEADAGESAATPLILGAEVWVWVTVAVVVVLALSLLGFWLAS